MNECECIWKPTFLLRNRIEELMKSQLHLVRLAPQATKSNPAATVWSEKMRKQLRTHNARPMFCSLEHGHPPESTWGPHWAWCWWTAIGATRRWFVRSWWNSLHRPAKLLQMNPVITFHYKTLKHPLQYHQLFHIHQSSQFVVLRQVPPRISFQNGAIVQCSPVGAELGSSSRSWPPRIVRRIWQA